MYNLMGQQVATLVDNKMKAGIHEVQWDASDFPSGIYFYRLEAGSRIMKKKLTLLK